MKESETLVEPLTPRELDVLQLMASGLTNSQIATKLILAPSSIKWYVKQIYAKLDVSDRAQVAARARELGLLHNEEPSVPPKHNLPVEATSFIGRQEQVNQVRHMMTDPECRLITLTGAGGVGKTRLAIKVAELSIGVFKDSAWLVELASVDDPQQVIPTVASVLGLQLDPKLEIMDTLQNHLRPRNLLLILDNCEHLIGACALLVNALLRTCPKINIIVTSREALGVEGEIPFSVPSLTFPDPNRLPPGKSLLSYEAIQLFHDRACISIPDFAVNDANARNITRICKRLDGIPLAIELAAARVKVLGVEQIANRLDESFRLLAGGFRTALPRHQTMRASIEWSFQLLSEAERVLLRRFSVFSGGWTLEAAETICTDQSAPVSDFIDLLAQLVNKSLVAVDDQPSVGIRYSLLDAIWDYAREKLQDSGEERQIRDRHLDYFIGFAEKAEIHLQGHRQVIWLNHLQNELSNLRSALQWGLQSNPEKELALASALALFWDIRGRWAEGEDWLSRGLAADNKVGIPGNCTIIQAKALAANGLMSLKNLEYKKAMSWLQESQAILQANASTLGSEMAFVLLKLAICAVNLGHYTQASTLAHDSLAIYRANGNLYGVSECLLNLGLSESDPSRAKNLFMEGQSIKREIGDLNGLAYTLQLLGEITVYDIQFEQASTWLKESLEDYAQVGNRKAATVSLRDLAWIDWVRGDYDQAIKEVQEALTTSNEIEEKHLYAASLLEKFDIEFSQGNEEDADFVAQAALKIGQDLAYKDIIASALVRQGKMAFLRNEDDRAVQYLEASYNLGSEIENKNTMAFSLYHLGKVASRRKDFRLAEGNYRQCMQLFFEMSFWFWDYIAYGLEGMAEMAVQQGDAENAARMYGAARRVFGLLENTLSPGERNQREQNLKAVQATLREMNYTRLWNEGYALSTDEAMRIGFASHSD